MTSNIAAHVQSPPEAPEFPTRPPNPINPEHDAPTADYAALAVSHNDEDQAAHLAMRTRAARLGD